MSQSRLFQFFASFIPTDEGDSYPFASDPVSISKAVPPVAFSSMFVDVLNAADHFSFSPHSSPVMMDMKVIFVSQLFHLFVYFDVFLSSFCFLYFMLDPVYAYMLNTCDL